MTETGATMPTDTDRSAAAVRLRQYRLSVRLRYAEEHGRVEVCTRHLTESAIERLMDNRDPGALRPEDGDRGKLGSAV